MMTPALCGYAGVEQKCLHASRVRVIEDVQHKLLPEGSATASDIRCTCPTLQEAGAETSPLAPLAAHRRVLGVVGLLYCPAVLDLAKAYAAFEKQCRWATRPSPADCCQTTVTGGLELRLHSGSGVAAGATSAAARRMGAQGRLPGMCVPLVQVHSSSSCQRLPALSPSRQPPAFRHKRPPSV